MRARAIVAVVGLLSGLSGLASPQPGRTPERAAAEQPLPCPEAANHRHCLARCTPANLMLLPCMAVGAKAMPACRAREVDFCIATCRRRFC